jgi:hypothetical protein
VKKVIKGVIVDQCWEGDWFVLAHSEQKFQDSLAGPFPDENSAVAWAEWYTESWLRPGTQLPKPWPVFPRHKDS